MPKIETWDHLAAGVRQHRIDRMRDRSIPLEDLNQLRLWVESGPVVPDGDCYRDFGSFKICGQGPYPKTFLLRGQLAKRSSIEGWGTLRTPLLSAKTGTIA
jgi:hypothetical protein